MSGLDTPLGQARLPGLTPAAAGKLARGLDLHTVRDLLEHVPRRYIDLSKVRQIGDLRIGEDATTRGTVAKVDGRHLRSRTRHLLTVTISDGSGYLQLVWWNQSFRTRQMKVGQELVVAGRIERARSGRLPTITNPFVENLSASSGVHTGRIIPVHAATAGVSPNQLRRWVHAALERFGADVGEPLPAGIVEAEDLMERGRALAQMHFPDAREAYFAARNRLVYEELFVLSAGLAVRKRRIEREGSGIVMVDDDGFVDAFLDSLPFEPTGGQRAAIAEIAADMGRTHAMNRLLQGEVGSGKTVVAVAAALVAASAGYQTAFMAPTEVLAEQHHRTVAALLDAIAELAPATDGTLFGGGFGTALLTGSVTGADRTRVLADVASGATTLLVGTHALIQEGVAFHRLGLAVVDEQHRFGVHQRVSLRGKAGEGRQPDTLIMTATPIPRTLALTLYGDLDVSTLAEMPPGRRPAETAVVATQEAREGAYDLIRAEAAAGRCAFVVCPLVEDSASLEAKAAESEFERIRTDVFPELRIGLIHGRMKSQRKEEVMRELRSGDLDVLVSTTVIEVGVDVPDATVMIIEDADRFGLSQLHQLRGRVGRGAHPGRCFLFTTLDPASEEARAEALVRLNAMATTADGFRLAEIDLDLRGAGHLFGRGGIDAAGAPAQAGRGDLRFANLTRDLDWLVRARAAAFALVDEDPTIERHAALLAEVRRRFADRLDWLFAS